MLKPIEVNFKLDKTIKRALTTELMIKSHDINVIEFHISFDGLELTADHTVKVLSVYSDTKSQTNVICDIVDGKAIYRPDTSVISQFEYVQNYVYVYHGNQSLDVRLFTYSVGLSQIDKTALKVKTVYDQSYSDLLADFEQALQDYKDSLPQASDLRAEVDALLETVEDNESARVDAEATRKTAEIDRVSSEANRKSSETTRVSNESERESAEVIRLANEADRVNAENTRSEFYEGFDGEIATLKTEIAKKANKKQEDWIMPTLLNGATGIAKYRKNEIGQLEVAIDINTTARKLSAYQLFSLPVGYRPPVETSVPAATWSLDPSFNKIVISKAGMVTLYVVMDNSHASADFTTSLS